MELKVGDAVEIKGQKGPVLTVNQIVNNQVECVWFNSVNSLARAYFDKDALEPANGHGPRITPGE